MDPGSGAGVTVGSVILNILLMVLSICQHTNDQNFILFQLVIDDMAFIGMAKIARPNIIDAPTDMGMFCDECE